MTIPRLDELLATIGRQEAEPLDRLGTAVTMADDLGALGDRLVTHYVAAARESGCSWSQIGGQLGVSKQAAQQGHVTPAGARRFGARRRTGTRFGRMTPEARDAVQAAHTQARELRHGYLGTEHLLLGLVAEEAGAGAVLRRHGVDPAGVRGRIDAGAGEPKKGHLPFTKRAKKVLELSVGEAGSGPIRTEHLLLGLIDEGEGLGAKILISLGADLLALHQACLEALAAQA